MTKNQAAPEPVRKSVTVRASANRAFQVFTAGMDSWWPRSHHIGKAPMTEVVVESHVGGRCYSKHEDGSESDWGQVLEWDPPTKFTMAWQVTETWTYEPDLAKSSEVEVRFTPIGDGSTRVDLEHRHFERHGAAAQQMRDGFDRPDAWAGMLELYDARITKGTGQE